MTPSSSSRGALRALMARPSGGYLLEAHSAVSARIAFEASVPGLWASSLTLSCAQGVRDNSEMTMTEALIVLESITSAVPCPVLFDGDTGYGAFGHFQQLVKRLESRSVSGVAIEDKVFPKTNSFLRSEQQGSRIIPLVQLKEEVEQLGQSLPIPETQVVVPLRPASPPSETAVADAAEGSPARRRRRRGRRGKGGGLGGLDTPPSSPPTSD